MTVILEPAKPAELAPLDGPGLRPDRRRTPCYRLVARGLSSRLIAHRLNLSTYTVQDHLKSIFTKSDTGSRGDLVARLFIDHYADGLTSVLFHLRR